MSLSIAIAAIVFANLTIFGILAYATSRAKLLTPHVSLVTASVPTPPGAVRPAPGGRAYAVPAGA